jgi:hypothetical protein
VQIAKASDIGCIVLPLLIAVTLRQRSQTDRRPGSRSGAFDLVGLH